MRFLRVACVVLLVSTQSAITADSVGATRSGLRYPIFFEFLPEKPGSGLAFPHVVVGLGRGFPRECATQPVPRNFVANDPTEPGFDPNYRESFTLFKPCPSGATNPYWDLFNNPLTTKLEVRDLNTDPHLVCVPLDAHPRLTCKFHEFKENSYKVVVELG